MQEKNDALEIIMVQFCKLYHEATSKQISERCDSDVFGRAVTRSIQTNKPASVVQSHPAWEFSFLSSLSHTPLSPSQNHSFDDVRMFTFIVSKRLATAIRTVAEMKQKEVASQGKLDDGFPIL
jgi:hypothetical protein